MANVYTSRFLRYNGGVAATPAETATVPAGVVWVVRSIVATAWFPSGPDTPLKGFRIYEQGAGSVLVALVQQQAFTNVTYTWDLRQLLQPADILALDTFDNLWHVWATGYSLTLP